MKGIDFVKFIERRKVVLDRLLYRHHSPPGLRFSITLKDAPSAPFKENDFSTQINWSFRLIFLIAEARRRKCCRHVFSLQK